MLFGCFRTSIDRFLVLKGLYRFLCSRGEPGKWKLGLTAQGSQELVPENLVLGASGEVRAGFGVWEERVVGVAFKGQRDTCGCCGWGGSLFVKWATRRKLCK